jgi:hypothetical protein
MIAILLAAAVAAAPPREEPKTFLASLTVPLRKGERLSGFRIDTWGVEFLALCRFPSGWIMRAGRSATPDGVFEGNGTLGATFLDSDSELRNLALIRLSGPVQLEAIVERNGQIPATFAGNALLDTPDEDEPRRAKLTYANLLLRPADRCPSPAP